MSPPPPVEEATSSLHVRRFSDDAADMAASMGSLYPPSMSSSKLGFRQSMGLAGMARRTLGICLLLVTVFLWTLTNFLASVRQLGLETTVGAIH